MIDQFYSEILEKHVNEKVKGFSNVGGGCINNSLKIETENKPYFLKWNHGTYLDMFQKEVEGLGILSKHTSLRIPEVIGAGKADNKSYLLMEWIGSGSTSPNFWEMFAKGLSELHRNSSAHYGLDHDNYIGRLPQANKQHASWYDFFLYERLKPQIQLANKSNLLNKSINDGFERLFTKLPALIPDEKPSLLHGDLWSGNFMTDENGIPSLVDPAVHYGHRETELAFTSMFGGFSPEFYNRYEEYFPLEPGFESRREIHNLYPLLVHVNLFGQSYLSGIIHTLNRFA